MSVNSTGCSTVSDQACLTLIQKTRLKFTVIINLNAGDPDAVPPVLPTPFDLTPYDDLPNSPIGQARLCDPSNTLVADLIITVTDAVNGTMEVEFPASLSDVSQPMMFDILGINSGDPDDIRRLLKGKIKIDTTVTEIPTP